MLTALDWLILKPVVHCIVPSRTLFPDNLYTTVLQAADQSKSVQCALRALSASYLGDPAGLALRYQALCDLAKGRLTEIETVAIHLTLLQASVWILPGASSKGRANWAADYRRATIPRLEGTCPHSHPLPTDTNAGYSGMVGKAGITRDTGECLCNR